MNVIPDLNVLDAVEVAPVADREPIDFEVTPAHARQLSALADVVPVKDEMIFNCTFICTTLVIFLTCDPAWRGGT